MGGIEGKIYFTKAIAVNDISIEGKISGDITLGNSEPSILVPKRHFRWRGQIVTVNNTYHIEISTIISDFPANYRYFEKITFELQNGSTINCFDVNETDLISKLPYTLFLYNKDGKSISVSMTKDPYIFHAFTLFKQGYYSDDLINYNKQKFLISNENNTIGELIEDNFSIEQTLSTNELEDTRFLIGCIAALRSMIKELNMVIL
jgi:hypothetical protein